MEILQDKYMSYMKYRQRPLEVDAIQFEGTPTSAVNIFDQFDIPGGKFVPDYHLATGIITFPDYTNTSRTDIVPVRSTDWIIRDSKGAFFVCHDSLFKATWEPINGLSS